MRKDARLVQLSRAYVHRVRNARSECFRFSGKYYILDDSDASISEILKLRNYFYRGIIVTSRIRWNTLGTWAISFVML